MKPTIGGLIVLIMILWLCVDMRAEEPKPKAVPLTEAQQLRIENLSLKQAIVERQREDLVKEQNAFITETCKAAGIDLKACEVDPQSKMVREKLSATDLTPPNPSPKK